MKRCVTNPRGRHCGIQPGDPTHKHTNTQRESASRHPITRHKRIVSVWRARAGERVAEIDAVHENAPPLPNPRRAAQPARRPRENRIRSGTVSSHIRHAESRCLFSLKAKRNAQRECSACVPGSTSVRASWYACRSARTQDTERFVWRKDVGKRRSRS